MRLLNAMRTVNPTAGGPVEAVIQTARALALDGHMSEAVSLDAADENCVRDFPFPVTAVGPGMGQYGYSPAFVPWLQKNAERFDAILVHGVWDYNTLGVWRALRKSCKPYFVYTHGMLDPWFKRTYPLKHAKKWLYWPWGAYRVLRDACGVLFTADDERQLARQSFWLYRCRELVVNYGTAPYDGNRAAERAEFFLRFPELRNKRIILFLGRVHVKKGCDLLIRAFAKTARDEALHLVIAGPNQNGEKERLEELARSLGIEKRITWTGMLSGSLKWGALNSADVFALASHQENFGVAVVEALGCGVPVLLTDKVNIWREIQSDGAGIIAKDDEAGATELLERWFGLSEWDRAKMRRNAGACFSRRFDIRQAAQQLVTTLRANGVSG